MSLSTFFSPSAHISKGLQKIVAESYCRAPFCRFLSRWRKSEHLPINNRPLISFSIGFSLPNLPIFLGISPSSAVSGRVPLIGQRLPFEHRRISKLPKLRFWWNFCLKSSWVQWWKLDYDSPTLPAKCRKTWMEKWIIVKKQMEKFDSLQLNFRCWAWDLCSLRFVLEI